MTAFALTSVSGKLVERLRLRNAKAGLCDFNGGVACLKGGEDGGDIESLEMGSEKGFSDGERGDEGVGEGEASFLSLTASFIGVFGVVIQWSGVASRPMLFIRGTSTAR